MLVSRGDEMSLAQNIKRRRLELRMSQQELADAMGYKSRSTIARIESGDNDVPRSKLAKMAQVLDVSVDYLLMGGAAVSHGELGGGLIAPREAAATSKGRNKNVAVVLAGGKSTRNQQDIPNQFINILDKPMIVYSLEAYQRHPIVDEIYVVCLRGWEDILMGYAQQYGIAKFSGVIPGGKTGILSAANAVDCLSGVLGDEDIVMLHESTRPLVSVEIISKLLLACQSKGNAIACESMYDRIQFEKRASEEGVDRFDYVDRRSLLCMQSPEAYRLGMLKEAFAKARQPESAHLLEGTYCGLMLHELGYKLNFCEGGRNNIKAVHQEDVVILTALIKHMS